MNLQSLTYTYLFLSIFFIKSLLVMNEEILVLFSWIVFVSLIYTYTSSLINNTFEEGREKFYKNMILSFDFQEKALEILINYYKVQLLTISQIKKLFIFSKSEINRILIKRQASFKFIIASLIENKLSSLADKETAKRLQLRDNFKSKLSFKILTVFNPKEKIKVISLKKNIFKKSMLKLKIIASS
jgi:hypothetical protein